jgi:hypothetical protein
MAEIRTTKRGHSRKMNIKDMEGLRVRTVRILKNSLASVPAGSDATVSSAAPRWGLSLNFDPCTKCGIEVYISKVPPRDIMIIVDDSYKRV